MEPNSTYTTSGNLTVNTTDTSAVDKFRERVEKYLRMSHQTLAEMLALRDEETEKKSENPISPNDYPWNQPLQPNQPYYPYTPYTKWCPLTSGGTCTNPFGDCINCPYHGGVTYCQTNTNVSSEYTNPNKSTCEATPTRRERFGLK